MRTKKIGTFLMLLGGALIISALLLFSYNLFEASSAQKASAQVLSVMQKEVPRQEPFLDSVPEPAEHRNPYDYEMTELNIDGYDYIGYLTIPSLDLELPVMSQWDYTRLRIAPCRQMGSTKSDDLVIAGHNYRQHFGNLHKLSCGELIYFTDMDGIVSYYEIGEINVISPYSAELIETSPWDIILYTCTYGGKERVMLGATRLSPQKLLDRIG